MKRIIFSMLAIIGLLLSPTMALAQQNVRFDPQSTPPNQIGGCSGAAANSSLCEEIKSDKNPLFGPYGILTKVASIFSLITGIIAVFMIMLSGLRYITSGGDPSKTSSARTGIMYSAIGVAVAVFAQAIVLFVLSKL